MQISGGGHQLVKLETLGEISHEETVFYIEKNGIGAYKKEIEKLHRVLNCKRVRNMEFAFRNSGRLDSQINKMIKDLKEMGKKYILCMLDAFSRMLAGVVLKEKKTETILEKLEMEWYLRYGYSSVGFYADNGGEFTNYKMEEFVSKLGIKIEFSPSYGHWSNGLNERNHYSADRIVRKLMDENQGMLLEQAVSRASWTHNTSIMVSCYNPLTLMTGLSVVHPEI